MQTIKEKRFLLERKAEYLREKIQQILNNYSPELRHKMLETQFRLTNVRGKLKFLRRNSQSDIDYRNEQMHTFSKKLEKNLIDSDGLIFHATPIYNAEKIIKSGRIISGRDLWTIPTSGDPKGKFSATTKDQVETSVLGYAGLNSYIGFLPAGVIFVLKAQNDAEYQMAKDDAYMANVNFKQNPAHLYGLISTPENLPRLKIWMNEQNHPQPVYDYNGFINHISRKRDGIFIPYTKNQKQV
ncbi:MAG: hypothetical protein E7021_02805 [Alphaproteobacteria bacterium]|nr:hypothetical protein [Alphaproteobacteria bacterium]